MSDEDGSETDEEAVAEEPCSCEASDEDRETDGVSAGHSTQGMVYILCSSKFLCRNKPNMSLKKMTHFTVVFLHLLYLCET